MLSSLLFVMALSVSEFPQQLSDLVPRMAGEDAKRCGIVFLGHPAAEALACAKAQMNDGKAFWLALEIRGVDSRLWIAAAQASDGTRWIVQFDSDVSGGSSPKQKSLLEVISCNNIEIIPDAKQSISCNNDSRMK